MFLSRVRARHRCSVPLTAAAAVKRRMLAPLGREIPSRLHCLLQCLPCSLHLLPLRFGGDQTICRPKQLPISHSDMFELSETIDIIKDYGTIVLASAHSVARGFNDPNLEVFGRKYYTCTGFWDLVSYSINWILTGIEAPTGPVQAHKMIGTCGPGILSHISS